MSLNDTPQGERIHIGIFGKRNAGKSSIINAITGQQLSIVSDVKGTTTDPVSKAMELLPLGPVLITDTPGLDDDSELGEERIKKAYQTLSSTDIAILIVDGTKGRTDADEKILSEIKTRRIPYIVVYNKIDIMSSYSNHANETDAICVSAVSKMGIHELKERIASLVVEDAFEYPIIRDLVKPDDLVILVVPIDKAAPKGRLILPQQQTIRELLECGAYSLVVRESELEAALQSAGKKPALVVTDSQAFGKVSRIVPSDIMLTSFSILMARHKGNLKYTVEGVKVLDHLKDGDKILISEGCTHHRQCGDIGTEKLPAWIRKYSNVEPEFTYTTGKDFPEDLSPYRLVIHCGGCMLNEREMKRRYAKAYDQTAITNYGIAISYMHGILQRSLEIFPDLYK